MKSIWRIGLDVRRIVLHLPSANGFVFELVVWILDRTTLPHYRTTQ